MDVGESSDIQEGNGGGIPEPGPTHNLARAIPVAFSNHLWKEELITAILTETNRYGDQYAETHRQHLNEHHKSRFHDFFEKGSHYRNYFASLQLPSLWRLLTFQG